MDNASFWLDLLKYGLPSGFIFSFFTWLVSIKKRKNDFISDLQKSIDLLSAKYKESVEENLKLMEKNTSLYADNLRLSSDKSQLLANQEKMAKKIETLSRKIDELTRQLKDKNNNGKINQEVAPRFTPSCALFDGSVQFLKKNGIEVFEASGEQTSSGAKGKRRMRQPHTISSAANDGESADIDVPVDDAGYSEAGSCNESENRRPP